MEYKENDSKKKRSPYMSTKSMLSIRMLAGAYLVYLSYDMIRELNTVGSTDKTIMIIFAIIFTVCGAVLIITSGLNIHNQYYIGSPLYPSNSSEDDDPVYINEGVNRDSIDDNDDITEKINEQFED